MNDVTFAWHSSTRQVEVLRNLSLQVATGESLGLMGRSGAGKSTVVNLLAGYLRPQRGQIREGEHSVVGPAPSRMVVFQEDGLWPWLTVENNIRLGERGSKNGGSDFDTDSLINRLGIGNARNAYPAELSGGMAKRAELARAIAAQPRVLMLDEALRSVDVATKQICIDLIQDFRRCTGAAVISVSHDVEEIIRISDRIVILPDEPGAISHCFKIQAQTADTELRLELLTALGYRS